MKVMIFESEDDYGEYTYLIRMPGDKSNYGENVDLSNEKYTEYIDILTKYERMQLELKDLYTAKYEEKIYEQEKKFNPILKEAVEKTTAEIEIYKKRLDDNIMRIKPKDI